MASAPLIREAGWFWSPALRILGFAAVYTPANSIIIRSPWINDQRIIRHELTHWHQRLRHGAPIFWALCLYYVLRYGYERSPFEVEARAAELGG